MNVTILQGEDIEQAEQTARRAGEILASGGLVVFPTETVYGIGASAASADAFEALRRFKNRADTQPFGIHLPTPAAAERYIDLTSPMLRRLVRKVFPGPVTLVVDVRDEVIADRLKALGCDDSRALRQRLYYNNTVGLRCPDDALAQRVLASVPGPVVASSANRHGQPPPMDAEEAAQAVGEAASLIVDGGRCRYSKPSTILRVRQGDGGPQVTIERAGVYDERFVRKLLRWTMLLVCSGNTCRSPMAEAIARDMLARQRGVEPDDLEAAGIRVTSAGVFAAPGAVASPEAVEALKKLGIDLSHHRSRTLSLEMIREADVIYCMTATHREAVLAIDPTAADKTMLLDPSGDVDDPIGAGTTIYQRCAELIRRRLEVRLKEQQP